MTESRPRRALAPDDTAPSGHRYDGYSSSSVDEDTVIFRRAIFSDDPAPARPAAPARAQPPVAAPPPVAPVSYPRPGTPVMPGPGMPPGPYQPPANVTPASVSGPGAIGPYPQPAQAIQLRAPARLGAPLPPEPDWWREAMGLAPARPPVAAPPPVPRAPQPVTPPYFAPTPPVAPPAAPIAQAPPPATIVPAGVPAETPGAGRRFSVDDLIRETTTDAMESLGTDPEPPAAAPLPEPEPTPPAETPLPDRDTVTLPAAAAYDGAPRRGAPAAPTRRRSVRPAILVIAGVLVVALIVGLALWFLRPQTGGQATTPLVPPTAPDPLFAVQDLAEIGLGANWQIASAAPTPSDVACVGQEATQSGDPRIQARRFISTDKTTNVVTQFAATFADNAQATAAFAAAVSASGTCPNGTGQIVDAFELNNLTDQASGITIAVPGQVPTKHTILLARTGRTLSVVDAATAGDAIPAASLANAAVPALNRLCVSGQGTCPSALAVARAIPSPGSPPGMLEPADVPLINPAAGQWAKIDRTQLTAVSSQCDGVTLSSVPGTTSTKQRTLILTGDPNGPLDFGIDQFVYTFGKAKDAGALSKALTDSLGGCAKVVLTAKVKTGDAVKGVGAKDLRISGSTYTITHTVNDKTTIFRVSVILVGSRVGYLLANPTATYDFTDAQWQALTLRAGERISQT